MMSGASYTPILAPETHPNSTQLTRRYDEDQGLRESGAVRTSCGEGPSDNTPTNWRHTGQENSNRFAKPISELQKGHLNMAHTSLAKNYWGWKGARDYCQGPLLVYFLSAIRGYRRTRPWKSCSW